jgi:Arc/MetJ family transcription regulator
MRTTLKIDPELLETVKALSGAKTKTQAVELALQEFVQLKRRQKLAARIGNWDDFGLTLADLEKMRGG